MAKGQESDGRARNWTFFVYPDSAPENWLQILTEMQVSGSVSPLHDKDVNGDGTVKKPHYHVLLCFDGKKSYEQIVSITEALNAPIPQRCRSIKGSVRYFTHMDNPEKAQYSRNDIKVFGGFDIEEAFKPTMTETNEILLEVLEFVENNEITEYRELMKYAATKQQERWFGVVKTNTFMLCKYINSFRHSRGEQGE